MYICRYNSVLRIANNALWSAALSIVFTASAAYAQSVAIQGGTSTLMRASGIEVNYGARPINGWLGAGYADGFLMGGYAQTRLGNYNLGAGDRFTSVQLATDVFDQSRSFSGRGVFVSRSDERGSTTLFGGLTTTDRSYGFFRSFAADQPTGAVLLDRKLTGGVELDSINVVQSKLTSIQSLRIPVQPNWSLSLAGGIGQGAPFASFATKFEGRRLQAVGGYISAGSSFQRIAGTNTNAPEHVSVNFKARYIASKHVQIAAGHENLFSPVLQGGTQPARVSLDSVNATSVLKGFRVGVGTAVSQSGTLKTTTQSYGLSRAVSSTVTASASVLRLDSSGTNSSIYLGSVQEHLSPRLSLTQGVSHQGDSNSVTWGVRYLSNRIVLRLEHDVLYTPLAGGFGGKPYTQAWFIGINFRLDNGAHVHLDSYVDPSAKIRYTSWVDGINFGLPSGGSAQERSTVGGIPRFIVKGLVQDTAGQPIWGICVQVDGQTAYSDRSGQFFLRFRKGIQYPVMVLPNASLNATAYDVVSAPVSVLADLPESSRPLVVTLKPHVIGRKQ